MVRPRLTILTDPVPVSGYFFSEKMKRVGRAIERLVKPLPSYAKSHYRGHSAVTRSLVEGLRKIGVPHSYNPKSFLNVAECVIVLSSVAALRQAVEWKREGRIRRLLAGPNIFVFPSDHREIRSPEVDLCITPSDWTCKLYVGDCPDLEGRCVAWPAGVDTNYWKPNGAATDSRQVLLFEKHAAGTIPSLFDYVKVLSRKGYKTSLIKFGSYIPAEYREMLWRSRLMIGFSRSESQGIAWAEAWSMDVPTLVWYSDTNTISGRTIHTSSAPYLTKQNGSFFDGPEAFERLLNKWENGQSHYHPRSWVLKNMSDEICARKLCILAEVGE
jgi:hypothetical protein